MLECTAVVLEYTHAFEEIEGFGIDQSNFEEIESKQSMNRIESKKSNREETEEIHYMYTRYTRVPWYTRVLRLSTVLEYRSTVLS
jgi:hypothetical protein